MVLGVLVWKMILGRQRVSGLSNCPPLAVYLFSSWVIHLELLWNWVVTELVRNIFTTRDQSYSQITLTGQIIPENEKLPTRMRGKELCQGNHQEMPATTSPEPFRAGSGAQEGHRLSDISREVGVSWVWAGWPDCSWDEKTDLHPALPCTAVPLEDAQGLLSSGCGFHPWTKG